MYVCICNAIKEKQILEAIANGDDSLEKLQASLEVATCCGGCQPMIEGYLIDAKASQIVIEHPIVLTVPKVEIFIPDKLTVAA